ncbi:bifunctional riboflavin kinase/FAD synthetase [Desulforhopalus sp. IMCC35007]|uniref:bifunctional riboflavin kinase/FAD synthetase n=1 Tax=Desulforhopalus sp. IMCC35007 TaxID=2569543 RepID=UPI0010ADE7F0|nr:bifunctional riboflavin kinase/FAD synthetase [Desulforhopalus sp. IMCC35007]TKB08744.1 bifunctional riboflavin kinase/FAD synthetase [Desulforhopalus sp. IMCC35007]
MKIFRNMGMGDQVFPCPCVTIGNFDGVHIGHQQLFSTVVEKARRNKGTSIAITFDPHPLQVLLPGGIKLISNCEQKAELIEAAGIDVLVVIPFTKEFAKTSADVFVTDFLISTLRIKELVVGYDYAFGKGRGGNIDFLKKQGQQYGFPVTVVDAFYANDQLVSSTRIRELVKEGKMAAARELLGRNYQIRGTVQVGKQRGGKLIGFPTANLKFNKEDLVPHHGVYVAQVIYGGRCYGGILNIGYNPTFGEELLVAETHIFDFNEDIYGKPIRVNLLKFLRGEVKFKGAADLAEQIAKDVVVAKQVLQEQALELSLACSEELDKD